MNFDDYTTVEEVLGGNVVLVGEEHGNERCEALAEKVLDEYQPPTLAIESARPSRPNTGARRAFYDYAKERTLPFIAIDENNRWHDLDYNGPLHRDANNFSHPIEEDGDLDPQAITDARNRIQEKYGSDIYHAMYTEREEAMAGRINTLLDFFDTPIVVGIGTFHIRALRDYLEAYDDKLRVDDRRIRRASAQ